MRKTKAPSTTKKRKATNSPPPKSATVKAAVVAAEATKPVPCKISSGFQVKASDMPVKINLCKDTKGTLATEVQLVSVDVYDDSGASVANQPTNLKSNSFVLKLNKGTFDINSTIGPAPGADTNAKPTVFLYEACDSSTTQLCAFIAGGPGCGFSLTVI